MPRLLLAFFLLLPAIGFSQKEWSIWPMGAEALFFTNDTVVFLNLNKEADHYSGGVGNALVSRQGNLLLSTDAIYTYDSKGNIINRSPEYWIHSFTPNSELLLPAPGDSSKIYSIFNRLSPSSIYDSKLCFHSLSVSWPDLDVSFTTNKEVDLVNYFVGTLTAHLKEKGNYDIVALNFWTNDILYAQLSENGISKFSIIGNMGKRNPTRGIGGEIKFSPNGQYIACSNTSNILKIFEFRNGSLDLIDTFNDFGHNGEFDPHSRYFYYSHIGNLFQYDIHTQTKLILFNQFPPSLLQLGIDGKIYANNNGPHADKPNFILISKPWLSGPDCSFQDTIIYPSVFEVINSFPNIAWGGFPRDTGLLTMPSCAQSLSRFKIQSNVRPDSVVWDFGDGAPRSPGAGRWMDYAYAKPGTYTLRVWYKFMNDVHSASRVVHILPGITPPASTVHFVAKGGKTELNAGNAGATYLWSTGDTTQTIKAGQGQYGVKISNGFCTDSFTIQVFADTAMQVWDACLGDLVFAEMESTAPADSIEWNWGDGRVLRTGLIKAQHQYARAGIYTVRVSFRVSGQLFTMARQVRVYAHAAQPQRIFFACPGLPATLDAGNPGAACTWSTGDTTQLISAPIGDYWVAITNGLCTDTFHIEAAERQLSIASENEAVICPQLGEVITLDAGVQQSYLWSTGETLPQIKISQPGTYTLSAVSQGCAFTATFRVLEDCPDPAFFPNAFTPNADAVNDTFGISGGGIITAYNLSIFNRWGALIFTSADSKIGWGGQFRGSTAPLGTYLFSCSYTILHHGRPFPQFTSGTLQLLR